MRYLGLGNIAFTRIDGKSYTVKDFREFPEYVKMKSVKTKRGDFIDEIATRKDVYGRGAEPESYRIFEMNAVKIAENNFDIVKCKTLDIPDINV